jgi:hypothetical protein
MTNASARLSTSAMTTRQTRAALNAQTEAEFLKAFDKLLSDAWDAAAALGRDDIARTIDTVRFNLRGKA